jgi:hypothetical protein
MRTLLCLCGTPAHLILIVSVVEKLASIFLDVPAIKFADPIMKEAV